MSRLRCRHPGEPRRVPAHQYQEHIMNVMGPDVGEYEENIHSFRNEDRESMTAGEWQVLHTVALATLLAWASGIRLYFVVFALGLAGYLGYVDLPAGLKVLQHPWVIGAAGFLLVMEFLVDKVPG